MAEDPEALTQLARLLHEDRLESWGPARARSLIDERFDLLVSGLLEEAAASDDVYDRESGLAFVRERLRLLINVLDEDQRARLFEALRERIEAW